MIQVKVDLQPIRTLMAGYADQMPFAIAAALNRTAEEAYAEMRRELPKRFTFRQKGLLNLLAPMRLKGDKAARKDKLRVILDTETRAAKLFRSFEAGETKTPRNGNNSVAVPTSLLRQGPNGMIPRWLFPANLGFQRMLVANPKGGENTLIYARGKAYKRGQKAGIFEMRGTGKSKLGGVYMRQGKEIRKLWHYQPRAKKPATLRWYTTINAVLARRWEINMRGMAAHAIRTARKGGGARMAEGAIGAFFGPAR